MSGRRPRLVAIDDDDDIRVLIAITFEREGWDIVTAASRAEGMAAVRVHDPDVVMLDLGLGDGQGREVLEALKADDATAWIPVVIVSGRSLPDDIAELLDCGAADFITKPWQSSELTVRLAAALRVAATHRAAGQ